MLLNKNNTKIQKLIKSKFQGSIQMNTTSLPQLQLPNQDSKLQMAKIKRNQNKMDHLPTI